MEVSFEHTSWLLFFLLPREICFPRLCLKRLGRFLQGLEVIEGDKPAVGGGLACDVGDLLVAMDAHDPLGVGLAIPSQLDDNPLDIFFGWPIGMLPHEL